MSEPTATESEERKQQDCDLVEELLHKLDCDGVSVKNVTRLGPPQVGAGANFRPLRMILESEASKVAVLKRAKT
jgi:hypothetical protein